MASKELYKSAIKLAGGDSELADASFSAICSSAEQPRRFFHGFEHYMSVAASEDAPFSNIFQPVRFLAGCYHDVAYVHIDRKDGNEGLHPAIQSAIEQFGRLHIHNDGAVSITLNDDSPALLQAANIIFGYAPDAQVIELQWYSNQNEYLSALFGLSSGLALGIEAKYLLAQTALIEATVPFGAPDRLLKLRARLSEANQRLEHGLDAYDIEDTLVQAEAMGNRDVIDFEKPFGAFVENSFLVLLENSMGNVSAENADVIDPVMMATAMSGMAKYLSFIADHSVATPPLRSVFHLVNGARHPMESRAIANIRKLNDYLRAASTELQLLVIDYTNRFGVVPANWGEVRRHLGGGNETTKQTAQQFFQIFGADVEDIAMLQYPCTHDMQLIQNRLKQFKAETTLLHEVKSQVAAQMAQK